MKKNENVPSTIANLTTKKLTLTENNALKYGLTHCILLRNIDKNKLRTNIDIKI